MKLLNKLILFHLLLFSFGSKLTEEVNLSFRFNSKDYFLIYDIHEVEFSDIDVFNIMYHSNHVRQCGNSVIKFLYTLFQGMPEIPKFIVKNVNITYISPLKFQDKYKIIGLITRYGITSMDITIYGVSHSRRTVNEMKSLVKLLKENDLGSFLKEEKEEKEKNDNGSTKKDKQINEEKDEEADEKTKIYIEKEIDTQKLNESMKELNKKSHKMIKYKELKSISAIFKEESSESKKDASCNYYFTATYHLVNVDNHMNKVVIQESFKKDFPYMKKESLDKLIQFFC